MKTEKYTVRAELDPVPNRKGEHSIYIKVTSKGKRVRIAAGHSVPVKMWDPDKGSVRDKHPGSAQMNQIISRKIHHAKEMIMDQQLRGRTMTLQSIKNLISKDSDSEFTVIREYAEKLAERLTGKFGDETLSIYKLEAKRIDEFHPGITFDQVDHAFLVNYEAHLRSENFGANTIHKILKTVRKFFNAARKDGVTKNYPFDQYSVPRYQDTNKTWLDWSEVEKIEKLLKLPMNDRIRKAATWFMLGCYSGLRYSDWLRFNRSMISGGNLILRAKKNGELVVMPIHSRLVQLLKEIEKVGQVEAEPNTNKLLKDVQKMAKIEKKITCHVSRHTFAVRCAELGISIETTAELMGISVNVCKVYYKVTGTKVKKEMEKWG